MNKSESIINLVRAVIAVMKEVESIDKNMTVGTGASSYSGVADKDVKLATGDPMVKHGLCILPIGVDAKTQIDRWEETTQYGVKQKQSVFTETTCSYLLAHESGEWVEVAGYGHGVDSQDKSAGKSTTYSLKYLLLYAFLIPTGKIDDADKEHSDTKEVPKAKTIAAPVVTEQLKKDILSAVGTAELTAIWNKNKPLQADDNFISLIKDRRTDLTLQTA